MTDGFITYRDHNWAKKAVQNINDSVWRGKVISVLPDLKEAQSSNLVITYIPRYVSYEDFCEVFQRVGKIASAILRPMRGQKDYQIAFLLYEDPENAKTSLKLFHESYVFDN